MDMVNEAIASFKDVAEKQLSESTKQAMRENSMLESQLRLLSTKFAKILPINDSLRAKIKTLKTELVLSADRERILMGRTKKRDEVIKLLAEKLKECDGLLVKMVDEVERFVADGAQPVMRRRESTGRRGSLSGASAFPEPTSITVSNEAGRPVSPVQQDKIAGTPGSGSTATGFVPSVSAQRESVSRTLASVLGYNSDETPLPSPTAAFGMGTLAEEQDEEAESDYWGAPVAQGRSKREMSMTVVEALANQFRGKLESITGTANSPQTTVEGPS